MASRLASTAMAKGEPMSILSGPAINKAIAEWHIRIDPFNPRQLNPNSYDVRLGDEVREYLALSRMANGARPLDAKLANPTVAFRIHEEGILLDPTRGYLMHTVETIWSDRYVPIIDGKSSVGRLFVSVHQTAGYGETGFGGQFTLEVTCVYPVRLYAGMRIGQVRFETVEGEIQQYEGHYRGTQAKGAVASMTWKQFEEDR